MFSSLLRVRLERSGLFRTVELRFPNSNDYLAFHARFKAVEETDRGRKWYARLAMRFWLTNSDKQKIMWRRSFDTQRPVEGNGAMGLVKTLSDIYRNEILKVVSSLADFVSSYPVCVENSTKDFSDNRRNAQ